MSLFALSFTAAANPEGGQIVGGEGSISQAGALTQINQASQALAINWNSFNVGASEVVQFVQPGASSVALNRIVGGNASEIFGRIDANGTVFLVNTAGVLFAEGAQINVGSLMVSGLDMTVEDFMDGRYNLTADGTPGYVINRGTIAAASGGSVALVGGQVQNSGLIRANYGRVTLAGAEAGYIDFDGDGLMRFEVTGELKEKLDGADAAVTNTGVIQAEGGEVILQAAAARGVFDQLINNEGIIEAGSISIEGGVVRLVAEGGDIVNSGTIVASSEQAAAGEVHLEAVDGDVLNTGTIEATSVSDNGGFVELVSNGDTIIDSGLVDVGSVAAVGGTVHALGNRVIVQGPSRLGSAGGAGGGIILIGGSYQGQNPLVRNASQTFVGADVDIDASAINSGSGGTVIVWSENYTWFYGTVSARGPPSGLGGFVEVSSHGTLAFAGLVDLRGGINGTLLLDPTDIQICDTAIAPGCSTTDLTNSGGTFSQSSNQANSTLRVSDLVLALGGANVVVTTASGGGSAGNITVEDPIVWSSANSLTLTASNNITINALARDGSTANGITAAGSGSLTLTGNTGAGIIQVDGAISLNGGTFIATASQITTGTNGSIAVAGGNITLTADTINLGAALSGTGTLTLQPFNAATTIGIGGAAGTFALSTAEIALLTDGFSSITIGHSAGTGGMTVNAVTFNDPVTLRTPAGGAITIAGALSGIGNASIALDAGTLIVFASGSGVTTADQNITLSDAVQVNGAVTVSTGTGGGGNVSFGSSVDGTLGTEVLAVVSGSGTITFTGAVGASNPLGLVLQSDNSGNTGTVTFSGAVNATSLDTFAHAYAVVLNAGGTVTSLVDFLNTGAVTLGNELADSFTFNGGLDTSNGPSVTNLAGSISTSNDAITLGPVTLTANTTLSAGTATLTLDDVTGSTFNLTLTADEVDLTGGADSVTGSGAVILQPATTSLAIDIAGLGGTGALDLTAAELAAIQNGHGSITIGRSDGTGGLTIAAVTFNDPVILRSPAGGTLAVDGQITGTGDASVTLDGAGATTVLSANIVTAEQDITISDSVVIAEAATVVLDTGTGGGGNISIAGTVDGTAGNADESLQLISGTGTIGVTGIVGGTDPLILILQSDVVGNTGAVTFSGAVNALSLTTFARGYSVSLLDGGAITAAVSFLNTAGVTLGNAGTDTITFNGGVTSTASTTTIAGTVATSDDAITLGAVTLAANSTVDSNAATTVGDVTIGAVTGAGFSLTISAGNGVADANVSGTSISGVNALTLSDVGGSVSFSGAVSATSLSVDNTVVNFSSVGTGGSITDAVSFANTGTLTLGQAAGTQTYNGGLNTTAVGGTVTLNGALATSDDTIALGAVTLGSDTTLRSGSGTITVASATGAFDLTLHEDTAGSTGAVTFTGNVTIDDLVTFGRGYSVSLQGAANSFTSQVTFLNTGATTLGNEGTDATTFDAGITATAGAVNLAGTVATTNDALSLGAVTMTADAVLVSGSGTITVASISDGGSSFSLDLGDGTQTGSVTFTGNVTINDLDTFASAYGVAFQGASNLIDTATTFLNTGTTTFGNDSADLTTFDAGVTATAGAVSLAGTLATTNDAISLGAATLTANTTLSAGTAAVTLAGVTGSTFSFTVTADEIDLTGAANSVTGSGALVLRPGSVAQAIEIAGAGGTGALDLTATEIATLANGFSSITIGRAADGTGTVTVAAAQAFNDNLTLVGGAIASNGELTSTGNAVTLTARTGSITDGNGATSNVTATSLTASAVTGIDLDVTITTLTSATVSGVGGVDINDTAGGLTATAVSTTNGAIALSATGGTLTVVAATAGTAGNITLVANEIQLTGAAGSIVGTGNLVLAPETVSQAIELGGAGGTAALDLTATELATLANGFNLITIGLLTTGTGAVTVAGAVTLNDSLYLVGGSITSNAGLTSSGNTVTFEARTANISDGDGGNAVNLTAGTISLLAGTSIDNAFDVAGVTSLTINVEGSFSVRGDAATTLSSLSVSVDPGVLTSDFTYTLSNFATLAFGLSDGAAASNCSAGATGCAIVNGVAWTGATPLNLTIISESGDLVLNDDNGGPSTAISMGTAGGNITLQAAADIVDGNTDNSDDPTPATADRNLVTTSTSTITFIAGDRIGGPGPVDDVGNLSSANEDIDVSGTGNFSITAPGGSSIYTDTSVTGLSLSGDPANEVVNHTLTSTDVTYSINEACADGHSCINVVTINLSNYDFSYTGLSGDIYIASNAINVNGGDVTIVSDLGSIFELTNDTTTEVTTTGLMTFTAANGIGTLASPLDIAGATLDASVLGTGGIYLNELNSIVLTGIDTVSGAIVLSAGTSLLDDASNATVVSGSSVSLTAGTALGATGANNEIDTTTTALTLSAGTDFFVANTGNLASLSITTAQAGDTNTYSLSSTVGLSSFTLTDAGTNYTLSLVDDGLVFSFTGDESIAVGAIDVSATGSVALVTQAAITDADGGVDVTAQSLVATAQTGISLDTAIDNLTASNSVSGGIDVVDTSELAVITVVAAGQAVSLNAGTGALTDGNGAGTSNVTAGDFTATAQTGIDLDTTVATLTTNTSSGNGNQTLREFDGLTDVSLNAGTGDISLAAGGAVAQAAGSIIADTLELLGGTFSFTLDSATNNVGTLAAVAGGLVYVDADDLTVGTAGTTTGIASTGAVSLTAGGVDGMLTVGVGATITATNQTVTLIADNMDLLAAISAGSGTVTLQPFTGGALIDLGGADAAGTLGLTDAELDQVSASTLTVGSAAAGDLEVTTAIAPAGVGALSLVSGGSVFGAFTITVPSLSVTADGAGGIGNGGLDPLTVSVDSLTTDTTTGNGSQFITSADALDNLDLDAGAGSIELTLTTGGIADVAADGVDIAAGGLVLTLSDAATQDVGSGANLIETSVGTLEVSRTGPGDIFIAETDDVQLISIATFDGSLTLTAGGELTVDSVNIGDNDGSLDESVSLTTSNGSDILLDTIDGAIDLITITADGAIEDNTGTSTTLVAREIDLNAQTGIGTLDTVEMSVNYVSADSASGDIDLYNFSIGDAAHPVAPGIPLVEIISATTDSGNITFVQEGGASLLVTFAETTTSGDINLTRDDLGTGNGMALLDVSAANAVTATLTGTSGGMLVDSVAAGDSITLNSLDDVSEGDIAPADPEADITAPIVTITAPNGVGSGGTPEPVEIDTANLTVNTSGNNSDQHINSMNGLTDLALNAGTGDVFLTLFAGGISDTLVDGDDITADAATVTLFDGTAQDIGASGNPIETNVNELSVSTAAGGGNQYLDESSGLNALALDAGAGSIELSALGGVFDDDVSVDVTAASLNALITGAFGDTDTAAGNAIQTSVDSLTVDTLGNNQFIRESDGLTALELDAGGGAAFLTLEEGGIADGDGLVDVTALGAQIALLDADVSGDDVGSLANMLGTDVSLLEVFTNAGGGDQFLVETNGITGFELNAGAGSVVLTLAEGALSDTDASTDITAASVTLTLADADDNGDAVGTLVDPIHTSVDQLTVDTSAGAVGGGQFLREANGLAELLLNAGSSGIELVVVTGSILSTDVGTDVIAAAATLTALAGTVGTTDTAAGNAIETSVDNLTVTTTNNNQFLSEASGLTNLALSAGTGTVMLTLVSGNLIDGAADGADVTADTISITAPAGSIGQLGNPLEIAGVTDLTLLVSGSFVVDGGGSTLTDVTVTVDSSLVTNDVWRLTNVANLSPWDNSTSGLYDNISAAGDLAIYNLSSTSAVNISITNNGNIYLTDESTSGAGTATEAINLVAGNITITALNGGIFDYKPTVGAAPADDSPFTDYNLKTDAASTVSLNAPGNVVGLGLVGDPNDIDVNGTGNLAINAASSNVSSSVALTSLSLTFDPVNDAVSFNLGGATSINIDEACLAQNVCLNNVSNSNIDFDFSLTAVTGNILLADFAIDAINDGNLLNGTGSVTLTATAGGIFRQVPGSLNYNIAADGPVLLSGAGGTVNFLGVTQTGAVGSFTASNNPITVSGYFNPYTLQLERTGAGEINVRGVNGWDTSIGAFSSTGAGATYVQSQGVLAVNTDVVQEGLIQLTSTGASVTVATERLVQSTAGDIRLLAEDNVVLVAGTGGSPTEVIADVGRVLLFAGQGDLDAIATIAIGNFTEITAGAGSADAITLRGRDAVIDAGSLISAASSGGGIRLFSAAGVQQIEVGGSCLFGGYCISDAELATFVDYDVLTVGESAVQSAIVIFVTATPVADADIIANSLNSIYFDDGGAGTGLASGTGDITVNAGSAIHALDASIFAIRNTNASAELSTGGVITLSAGGQIGFSTARLQFAAGQGNVVISNSPGGAFLGGLGNLTLGSIATGGGSLDVVLAAASTLAAGSTLSTGAGNITLASDEIDFLGGAATVTSTATLVLQPVTNGLAIDIGATADAPGSLSITDADIAALTDGFTIVAIGRLDGSHAITVVDAVFTDPVMLRAPILAGAIVDDVADSTTDLTAPSLSVNVGSGGVGQGAGGSLDIDVASLNVTSAGAVSIEEANDVAVGLISAAAQTVTLVAGSQITDGNGALANVSANLLDVTAVDGIDLDTAVGFLTASNTTVGGIDIAEADGMALNTVSAPGQAITLNGGTGAITDNNLGATNVSGLSLNITAATGINIDTAVDSLTAANTGINGIDISDADDVALNAVTAGGQLVTLASATGALTDGNGAATNVTAGTTVLSAVTGIGSGDALELAAGAVAALNTTSGDIQLAQPSGTLTVGVSGAGITNAGGDIVLSAAAGSIAVDGDVDSGAGRTTLTASDQITAFGGGIVYAAELVMSAANGISSGCNSCFFLEVGTLQATNTNFGIELNNTGDIVLADLTGLGYSIRNTNGGFDFENTGTITVADAVITGRKYDLTAFGATADILVNANMTGGTVAPFTYLNELHAGRDLIQASGTTIASNSVTLFLTAVGEVSLAAVSASGTVDIDAGVITDNNGATTNVTANLLDATAATGIDLDTAIAFLTASNTTSGAIDIADTDGFAVNTVNGLVVTLNGGTGSIGDNNGTGTNVSATVFSATAGGGIDLDTAIDTLDSVVAGGTVDISDADGFAVNTVTAAGQTVSLSAGVMSPITDGNADGTTNVTAATLNLAAGAGVNLDTDITTLNSVTAGGTVDIADVDSFAVNTVNAAGQTVNLTAGGAITDGNADGTTNVTANLLNAAAVTGINLDTAIALLTASNTTSGNVDIADTNGFAVNTVSAPGQTVTLNGGTGTITDNNGDLVSNITAATLSAFAAQGIDLDTTVDFLNGSTSGAGNVRFDEANGLTVTSFTTANGAFTLTTSGATTLTSIVSTTSNDANDITVTAATGTLSVGTVNAGTGSGDVTLTATTGALVNSASAVTGDVVTLNAQSGIGASGNRITTTATTLAAATTAAGAIWLNETNGVTLSSVAAADGLIDIVTGGDTTLSSVVSSTDSDANDITILATSGNVLVDLVDTDVANDGALGDVTITASTGSINDFHANPDVTLDVRGDVLTIDGATGAGNLAHLELDGSTLNVSGGAGGIGVNDLNGGTVVLTLSSAGDITYGTGGTIYVDQVIAGGAVTLNSFGGSINDNADDLITDIVGTTVTLNAFLEIGGNALNVLVPVFDPLEAVEIESTSLDLSAGVDVSTLTPFLGAAAIVVRDIGGTTLTDLDTVNGDITIQSDSALSVGDVFAGTVTLSDVVIDATGVISDAAGDVTADLLTVDAAGAVTLSTDVNNLNIETSAAGDVTITETDDVTVDLIDTTAGAGAASVTAIGSITVGTIDVAGSAVTLNAGTAIADGNAAAVNVTAGLLDASAATGISLDTAIDFLTASNGGPGGIDIADTDGFAVNTVDAVGQTVTLDAGTGGITDNNGVAVNVTADLLDVSATTGIALDATINQLTAFNATSGDISVVTTGDFTVAAGGVTNAGGDVVLNSGGGISLVGDVDGGAGRITLTAVSNITNGGGTLIAQELVMDAATIGQGCGLTPSECINTQVAFLQARAQSGGLQLNNTGDLSLADLTGLGYAILNSGGGFILGNTGSVSVDADVTGRGRVVIVATGATSDITVNADLFAGTPPGFTTSQPTGLVLTAGRDILQATGTTIRSGFTGGQDVALTAVGGITQLGTAQVISDSGDIILDAGSDVTVGVLDAVLGTVSVSSGTGGIVDGNGATTNITGILADLDAATGIGAGDAIETAVEAVNALNAAGDINLGNNLSDTVGDGIVDIDLVTTAGDIAFVQTGGASVFINNAVTNTSGNIVVTADNPQGGIGAFFIDSAGSVAVSTIGTGEILVRDITAVTTATLTAATTINEDYLFPTAGASSDALVDITANSVVLLAGTGIGDIDAVELTATTVSADTTNGDIVLTSLATGPVTVSSLTTGTGLIAFDQISGNQPLTITNASTGSGPIAVTNAGGDLTAVSITAGGPSDVSLTTLGSGNIVVGAVSGAGAFLNAAGAITDSNGAGTNVTASLLDATATTGISLDTAIDFLTASNATSGDIDIADSDGFATNTVTAAGQTVTLNGGTGAISDNNGGGTNVTANLLNVTATAVDLDTDITLLTFNSGGLVDVNDLGTTTLSGASSAGTLILASGGALTDGTDGDLAVTNNATLSGTAITLGNDAGNATNFGTLTFSGAQVSIAEDSDTVLAGANTATDTLVLTSAGTITDGTDGDLAVTNNATLSGTAITLGNDAGNDTNFGTLTFSGGAISIAEDSDTVLANASTATTLALTSAATITDGNDGDLAVTGTAALTGTDITLGDGGLNNATTFGSLTFVGTNVTILEDDATQLTGASTASSLTLSSGGAITQTAGSTVGVTGTATLTASGNDITLNQANDFGTVAITIANNATLNDVGATGLILGTITVSNLLDVTAEGDITNPGNLSAAAGDFTSTTGDITIGGAPTTIFGTTLTFNAPGAVTIQEDSPIQLANANTAGSLSLSSNGAIDDGNATLNVTDATTLTATGSNIFLDNAGHVFDTLAVTDAVNVTVRSGAGDPDGIIIGGITTSSAGDLTIIAEDGDITTNGALVISGDSSFTANGALSSITVNDAGNDFTGTVSFGGTGLTNVTVRDLSALDLAGADLAGDLFVQAAGISASGVLSIGGTATFAAGAGNSLDLDNTPNDFNIVVIQSALDVDLFDVNTVTLGNITASGYLDVEADGSIANAGTVVVSGTTTLTANGGDVDVDDLNNNFIGAVTATATGNIFLTDVNALLVDVLTGNSLTLTAGGAVTDAQADGGTPAARSGDNIVVQSGLTVTAPSFGAAGDPIEISAPNDMAMTFTIGSGFYADFLNDVSFATLGVVGATTMELTARTITVDGDFDTGVSTDIVFVARGIIVGGGGTIRANQLQLDALNQVAFGGDNNPASFVIGRIDAPILLDMANGANYLVPTTTLNGFGFISASNFTGTDFQRIFNDSNARIFLIANFTDLIASVQGSFITSQIFTIDSSQFRADLNIFGVDGAGVLLPPDQCEDEESPDCAKQ